MKVLFRSIHCNFGQAEENRSLHQGLHYVEVYCNLASFRKM